MKVDLNELSLAARRDAAFACIGSSVVSGSSKCRDWVLISELLHDSEHVLPWESRSSDHARL